MSDNYQESDFDYESEDHRNIEIEQGDSDEDGDVAVGWKDGSDGTNPPLVNFMIFRASGALGALFSAPFELPSILRQVQYLPRRRVDELYPDEDVVSSAESTRYVDSDLSSNDGNAEGYSSETDSDQEDIKYYRYNNNQDKKYRPESKLKVIDVDKSGYVQNVKPPYQIPPLRKGMWSTMTTIAQFRHEGFFALWKITFPFWLQESVKDITQPWLDEKVNETFDLYDTSVIPLHHQRNFWPNLWAETFVRSISRFIAMPLEVLTVHMAVQTSDPLHAPYKSTWHAYKVLMSLGDVPANTGYSRRQLSINGTESSGTNAVTDAQTKDTWIAFISRMYPFPMFTFISYFVEELFDSCGHLVIRRLFNISPYETPFKYGFYLFCHQILGTVIRLPLETVRRRLFVSGRKVYTKKVGKYEIIDDEANIRKSGKSIDISITAKAACVSLPDKPYTSPWNCFTRIISEEAIGDPNLPKRVSTKRRRNKKRSKMHFNSREGFFGGVGQLFTGFWLDFYTNIGISVLYGLAYYQFDEGDFHYY